MFSVINFSVLMFFDIKNPVEGSKGFLVPKRTRIKQLLLTIGIQRNRWIEFIFTLIS